MGAYSEDTVMAKRGEVSDLTLTLVALEPKEVVVSMFDLFTSLCFSPLFISLFLFQFVSHRLIGLLWSRARGTNQWIMYASCRSVAHHQISCV